MFLSSKGIRGINFKSVYSFLSQERPSYGNQRILNFRVMAVCDIKLRSRLMKNVYFSRDFYPFKTFKYL